MKRNGISNDQAALTEARLCGPDGLRHGPEGFGGRPDLYFVDAKARAIEDFFCELLKELIKEALSSEEEEGEEAGEEEEKARRRIVARQKKIASAKKESGRQKGIPEFQEAVRKAAELKKEWATVPAALRGYAKVRGALVVFQQPYPFFQRMPHASFRGLTQIDGDDLLRQIVAIYRQQRKLREVLLPYCDVHQTNVEQTATEARLIATMAQELRFSKEFAKEVMEWYAGMVARELRDCGAIRLRHIGTLRLKGRQPHQQVTFEAGEALKRHFEVTRKTNGEGA